MALIGYVRLSKVDGSQTTDLQCDALLTAGWIQITCMRTRPRERKKTDQNWRRA